MALYDHKKDNKKWEGGCCNQYQVGGRSERTTIIHPIYFEFLNFSYPFQTEVRAFKIMTKKEIAGDIVF